MCIHAFDFGFSPIYCILCNPVECLTCKSETSISSHTESLIVDGIDETWLRLYCTNDHTFDMFGYFEKNRHRFQDPYDQYYLPRRVMTPLFCNICQTQLSEIALEYERHPDWYLFYVRYGCQNKHFFRQFEKIWISDKVSKKLGTV